MNTDRTLRGQGRLAAPRKCARFIWRWSGRFGLFVLGVLLYAVCTDVFGGYARWHTETLSWAAVVVLAIGAAVVWLRDERRDDASTDEHQSDRHDVGNA